jgi:outer membrane protein TolC
MFKISSVLILMLAFWMAGFPLLVQSEPAAPATVVLTLEKAEAFALGESPAVSAAREREKAARRRVLPAYLPNDPMVMVERSGEPNGPFNWNGATMEMLMAEEQIRFPGKSLVEASRLRAEARKASSDSDNSRRNILLQAREGYWDFYYRARVAAILNETESQWKTLSVLFKSRDLTGQWASVKAVRTQVDLARALNERLTASKALRVSQANLDHLFNASAGAQYVLGDPPPAGSLTVTREEAIRRALGGNPEISSAVAMNDAAKAMKRSAVLEHLPDFTVRAYGNREVGSSGFSDYGMRVGMTLPIFFPFKQTQASREASALSAASAADLTDAKGLVAHEVEEAYVEAESSWELLKSYEDANLAAQLKRAWEASRVAYRNEQMPASELIESYNMYLETLSEIYRARADYGKALAQLEFAMGTVADKGENHEKE